MQEKKVYTLTQGKLKRGYYQGLQVETGGVVSMCGKDSHFMILHRFCSYEDGSKWGRFHCKAVLPPDCILVIRAFAMDTTEGEYSKLKELEDIFYNASISAEEKRSYFEQANGKKYINQQDILLYELTGKYLFISIEIIGDGQGFIKDMTLDTQGDNFMNTFPEIYQEEGGFFHRFMSVFSSIYQDINDEIYHMDQYIDLDTAPKQLLYEYADWLGLEIEGEFLKEDMLRKLLKEAYQLNKIKGTKQVLKRLIKLLSGEDAIIVERNRLESYMSAETRAIYQKLYGKKMQDIVILVNHKPDEKLRAQVLFLLKQFKPARSNVRLVFYEPCAKLDAYCYLDKNAAIEKRKIGELDRQQSLDHITILQ